MKKILEFSSIILLLVALFVQPAAAYESLTYLYGSSTSVYLNRIDRTGKSINTVCPDYFNVLSDGSIEFAKKADPLLIAGMHDRNIKVTPYLSNNWARTNARLMLANRWNAAAYLASVAVSEGYDGLDIDIQNINEYDKENFTDFIRLLRAALPKEKSLTVCVPANPYYTDKGWQGGYDYATLAVYADHIFMMTYDESYESSPPGPVGSMWFVENSIKYGLGRVPAEKLMVGIPFYGRYWKNGTGGYAFTCADIDWIIKNLDATVSYDEQKQCARAIVVIPPDTVITTWGGRKLTEGTYEIWFDNERSYEAKLALVRKYGLRGVGSWALGQEPVSIWSDYLAWLDGSLFDDISGHWALSYITQLNEQGILNGKGHRTFAPEDNLTRAEAAAMLVRLAGVEDRQAQNGFEDTAGHWAERYIAIAKDVELVSGISESVFEPERNITREEFAVMAERYTNILDNFDASTPLYLDVNPAENLWSSGAIIKLSLNNVLSGYPDGTFRPHKLVTRAEAAKIIRLISEQPTRFLENEILPLEKEPMSPR